MKYTQYSFQRYEKKYLLSEEQYQAVLAGIRSHMEEDHYGQSINCSMYYDTPRWDLIRKSIEKPVYKEKLRVRSYGVPKAGDKVFIELKKKFDGVVYKRRIEMPAEDWQAYLAGDTDRSPGSQISREIEWFQRMHQAVPKVYIAYDRRSYAGLEDPDLRITFDQNIRCRDFDLDFQAGDFGEPLLPGEAVLMEIKIPAAAPLWLAQLLSALKIRPVSFSKYGYYYTHHILGQDNKEVNHHVQLDHRHNDHPAGLSDLHRSIGPARIA